MKIKHNLKILEDGVTIEGKILETIFEEGEERGGCEYYHSKEGSFYASSCEFPELHGWGLYVWGSDKENDNKTISYTYKTPEEAQQILAHINEFTILDKSNTVTVDGVEYKYVYVSDTSEEAASIGETKRILLYSFPGYAKSKYIVVNGLYEEDFINGECYEVQEWKYIIEIPEEKTITIKTEDGQELEISEEKAKELGFKIK